MQTERVRTSTMPSALLFSDLLAGHGGNPPLEVLEQVGFDRTEADSYLKQRAARMGRCTAPTCPGS